MGGKWATHGNAWKARVDGWENLAELPMRVLERHLAWGGNIRKKEKHTHTHTGSRGVDGQRMDGGGLMSNPWMGTEAAKPPGQF